MGSDSDMASGELGWEVKGQITPAESVSAMMNVITAKSPEDSGTFWCWDGRVSLVTYIPYATADWAVVLTTFVSRATLGNHHFGLFAHGARNMHSSLLFHETCVYSLLNECNMLAKSKHLNSSHTQFPHTLSSASLRRP